MEWSSHEQSPGQFDFSGPNDIVKYIETAQKLGLDVILRPGPFIDAERDLGGLPSWLLKNPNVKLRTNDKYYMDRVKIWYTKLFSLLRPYLFKNGGPITMIQVENEYGSYAMQTQNKDMEYLTSLRDLTRELVGDDVVLFSTDGAGSGYLVGGVIPEVLPTVDFGCGNDPNEAFRVQRMYSPRGPLVNSEYYPGWLDHWEHPHSKVATQCVTSTLGKIFVKFNNFFKIYSNL